MFSTNTGNLIWTLLVFAGFIFSVCLHEFGHAIVAYWGGDRSVKEKGYLTLNPLKYTHPTYSIVMPFIFVLLGGIPLPGAAVYINKGALKGTGWRSAVSAAGPLATLIVAIAIAVAISFFPAPTDLAQLSLDVSEPQALLFQGLALLLTLEVAGVFLNLIPVPGLDGYGIIEPWLPIRWQRKLRRYANYGVWFLFAAFFFVPSFSQGFWTLIRTVVEWCGVSDEIFSLSYNRFRGGAQLLLVTFIVLWVIYSQWKKRQPQVNSPERITHTLTTKLTTLEQKLARQRDVSTLSAKAQVLVDLEQYDQALLSLDEALQLRPDDYENALLKGYVCHQLQQLPEAIATFQTLLKFHPQDLTGWQNLGLSHLGLKQYDQAIAAFEQASQYAPSDATYLQSLHLKSRTHFYQQQYETCLAILNEILLANPQDAHAAYNEACCYAHLGQIESGITALTRALTNDKTNLRQQAQGDEDLEALRSHPEFARLVA